MINIVTDISNVHVRFAHSPTGPLHLGNARTTKPGLGISSMPERVERFVGV